MFILEGSKEPVERQGRLCTPHLCSQGRTGSENKVSRLFELSGKRRWRSE